MIAASSRSGFPGCCGASCIVGFYTPTGNQRETNMGSFNPKHLYLGILTEAQSIRHKDALKAKGFRMVSDRVVNGNSGNRLYLWIRDEITPKRKPRPVKKSMFGGK